MVVDTNVLLYAVNRDCEEHEAARAWIERLRRGVSPWFLTWGIVYEFLRVATHRRVLAAPLDGPTAWAFIAALLVSPSLEVLEPSVRHARALGEEIEAAPGIRGNLFHDAHTVVLMREHGVNTILTRDLGFHRFPEVHVVDPLG